MKKMKCLSGSFRQYFYAPFILFIPVLLVSCNAQKQYDIIVRNAMIYDGNGSEPYTGDIGIRADTIAFIGDLSSFGATTIVDARKMAVAPGFINMLSWANESLIEDGRSESDIRQGVTLEVMGEGWSMGPYNERMKKQEKESQSDIKYDISWNTLGGYLDFMEKKGITCNIASFVGAATVREYILGEDDIAPNPAQLDSMRLLVRNAMEEGALGVGSSLIYPPAFFAKTDELAALCQEASKYGGSYISHIRSEGNRLFEATEELIDIAKKADVHAEIYHIKAAGKSNWWKMDSLINLINQARKEGLDISADMYTYTAGGTGLTATMPPSLQDGGFGKLRERLQDPVIRKNLKKEMNSDTNEWENFYKAVGSPDNILLVGFKQDSLKKYTGKTLLDVSKLRGTDPEETAMDLIVQDSTRIEAIFFLMDENNLKKEVQVPWISFGSDEGSYAPEGVFLKFNCHPRAYGNVARLFAKYVRDEKLISVQEAVRKLTSLPAKNLKIKKRGELKVGNYADLVIFDPDKFQDHATFDKPHQYATGMEFVLVNGQLVLKNGEHTGATPGRFVKGPGFIPKSN